MNRWRNRAAPRQHQRRFRIRILDGDVGEPVRIGARVRDFELVRPHDQRAIGHGRAARAIDDEGEQPPRRGLGDDGQVGDDHERVGAEIFVRGFDQVQPLLIHRHWNGFRLPALRMRNILPPDRHHLLLIEQRQPRITSGCGDRLPPSCRHPIANRDARVRRVLRSKAIPNGIARAAFDLMEALDNRNLSALPRRIPFARPVYIFHFLKEKNRIRNPVHAELERIHILGPHLKSRLIARPVSLTGTEREVRFGIVLRPSRQKRTDDECSE